MPSLRKRVSSYFRQLSFHNEPREKRHNINENTFVTKYLQGLITLREGPPIIYGKNPTDLPNYELRRYENGSNTIIGCYTGPSGGLTTVKRTEKHLSVLDADIDFIDTHDEEFVSTPLPKKSPQKISPGQPIDNTTMVIKVAGHEYCVTNKPKRHSKSHSLGSISDLNIEIEKTKIEKSFYCCNNNCETVDCQNSLALSEDHLKENLDLCDKKNESLPNNTSVSKIDCQINGNAGINNTVKVDAVSKANQIFKDKSIEKQTAIEQKPVLRNADLNKTNLKHQRNSDITDKSSRNQSYGLSKSQSEGNPFHHKKRGRIIKIDRPNIRADTSENSNIPSLEIDDSNLPNEWNKKSDFMYGLSDSLYDRNQVTRNKNGDPIADCFGIIARNDSAILAVADGVNWGEKASIAAKSAVHGSLHYLNKTIFNDTKPFENLTIKTDETSISSSIIDENINLISNTREVFICLLRAFNCAHDLILENKGMLTTLTVAVILPLKQKLERRIPSKNNGEERRETETQYVCCVCNVGDTLAYVYSQKHGVRELTKGSHDINCNRDMRDALGALGPVDGINPELSNLTLSITTLRKGDIVIVASDGLTDNFDPNVCRFAVNSNVEPVKPKKPSINKAPRNITPQSQLETKQSLAKPVKTIENPQKPPVKPPRRSKNRDDSSRSSAERSSIKSATMSEKSSSQSIGNESLPHESQGREESKPPPYNQQVDSSSINKAPGPPNNQKGSSKNPVESSSNKPLETSFDEPCDNTSNKPTVDYQNPLVQQFMRENSVEEPQRIEKTTKKPAVVENKASSLRRQASSQLRQDNPQSSLKSVKQKAATSSKTLQTVDDKNSTSKKQDIGYKFLRSKTSLDIRSSNTKPILRNDDGIPYVTPIQRYELQLLLIEDILKHGISVVENKASSLRRQASSQLRQDNPQSSLKSVKQKAATSSKTLQTVDDKNSTSKKQDIGYKFLRSKTSLDIRSSNTKPILRNDDGIPYVTPIQRYELQLLLIEDILKHGISGRDSPCTSARKLCENLVSFTISITSAKRHTLEDQDLYFDNRNGVLVEVSGQEKKIRRKKGLEKVQNLPGKLDHVTVVAYNVGNFAH